MQVQEELGRLAGWEKWAATHHTDARPFWWMLSSIEKRDGKRQGGVGTVDWTDARDQHKPNWRLGLSGAGNRGLRGGGMGIRTREKVVNNTAFFTPSTFSTYATVETR